MLDYRVFTMKEKEIISKKYRKSLEYDEEPTGKPLSDFAVAALNTLVPEAESITVHDFPSMCNMVWERLFSKPVSQDDYWFIHYSTPEDACTLGCGNVIIMERATGKVVYNGPDDGE